MAAISPRPSLAAHSSLSSDNNMRPNLMKRQSSQSSHASSTKHGALSPGSLEQNHQPQRHHVKPAKKGRPGVVLPRNNHGGSGRNLVKLAQQAQQAQAQHAAEEGRKRSREKSRESDTEIRLPGSLDEHRIRFAGGAGGGHLPRNTSHTKLKKNLSHGHLVRLGSDKSERVKGGPPSPGLKARNKRPKSADMLQAGGEKDLHEQEVELAAQQQGGKRDLPKKVGFAVASDDGDDAEGLPNMEGSGLQGEDEWTDQSASASPYSTRQNTANNSRRASMNFHDKPEAKLPGNSEVRDHSALSKQAEPPPVPPPIEKVGILTDGSTAEESEDDDNEDDDDRSEDESEVRPVESTSPSALLQTQSKKEPQKQATKTIAPSAVAAPSSSQQSSQQQPPQRSLIHQTKEKEHANPAARRLLNRNAQPSPAPALVSNVSALDDARSARTNSPAPSMQSLSRETSHVQQGESSLHESGSGELVSRFMPSASHPNGGSVRTQSVGGSGPSTTMNTPKNGSIHTPDDDDATKEGQESPQQERLKHSEAKTGFGIGPPTSPGSGLLSTSAGARSVSSGGTSATIHARPFRNEQRMMNEKAAAENEDASTFAPIIPGHVFDRRNESLKSYLNLRMLGGDGRGGLSATTGLPNDGTTSLLGSSSSGIVGARLFEGRFKAVNTELKVVQRFRDPIAESISRLQKDGVTDMNRLRGSNKTSTTARQQSLQAAHAQKTSATTAEAGGGKLSAKSKSAVSLHPTAQPRQSSNLSTSASPPKIAIAEPSPGPAPSALTNAGSKSSSQINKRPGGRAKVSFSGSVAFDREASGQEAAAVAAGEGEKGKMAADEIARRLWESVGS